MKKTHYTLRPANENDIDKIIEYKTAMALDYIDSAYESEQQRVLEFIQRQASRQLHNYDIVTVEGETAGIVLALRKDDDSLMISELFIEEKYRNRGIGTAIIRDIVSSEQKVNLWVEKDDVEVWSLFRRLGFKLKSIRGSRYYVEAKSRYLFTVTYFILFLVIFAALWDWNKYYLWFQKNRIVLSIIGITFLGISIFLMMRRWCIDHKRALGILVITLSMVAFFPFVQVKAYIEYFLYKNERNVVVEKLKTGELQPSANWDLNLDEEEYDQAVQNGHVYKLGSSGQVVAFRIGKNLFGGMADLVYSSGGEEMIRENEGPQRVLSISKVFDDWYCVEIENDF